MASNGNDLLFLVILKAGFSAGSPGLAHVAAHGWRLGGARKSMRSSNPSLADVPGS